MGVALHGHELRQGETAFAFVVLRFVKPAGRGAVVEAVRFVAALVPDAERAIVELDEQLGEDVKLVALPWSPPASERERTAQRASIDGAAAVGVDAAWFFQTGSMLRARDATGVVGDDDGAGWEDEVPTGQATVPIVRVDLDDEAEGDDDEDEGDDEIDDDDVDLVWSHGPPPLAEPSLPVDNYPAIVDELDWEDFGIALKLAGPRVPGEVAVLHAFHQLWLAPYAGRFRNAAVTLDPIHHAARLWVDRFATPTPSAEQVHHLLWIVAQLHAVVPVAHARFEGATMAEKYAGLVGDTRDPFVLAGNPLVAEYARGGDAAVDAWIAVESAWSREEVAHMLRELAIDVVMEGGVSQSEEEEEVEDEEDEEDEEEVEDEEDEEDEDEDDDDDDDDDDRDDDDELEDDDDQDDQADGDEDEDRGRHVTRYAGELLRARAEAGRLDPRAREALAAAAARADLDERARRAAAAVLAAGDGDEETN
jgi:hypothetical protein